MTPQNLAANVTAELGRSDECLRAARALLDLKLYADGISRLYYALYHAAFALLLTVGLEPRTHGGVMRLLAQHFVKPGRLLPDDGRLFARMQKYREEADYGRAFVVSDEGARQDLAEVEALVARIRALLADAGLA